MTTAGDKAFLLRWLKVVTLGEVTGFLAPAAVGPLVRDASPAVSLPALLVAGLLEGAVLGWAQWSVASRRLPALSRRWVWLTAFGATLAYAVVMPVTTFWETLGEWAIGAQVALFVTVGIVLLLTIGTAQWVELRHHVAGAARWVGATALAWCLALGVFMAIATPLWTEGQALWLTVLIGVFAGLVMALVMAAVTGAAMVRLTRTT